MTVTEKLGGYLMGRTSRRSFLARTTMTATALSMAPLDFLLRPGSAYAAICECAPGYECDCSSLCCDGYTQFCCTINNGLNACPTGTFAGGWWKADGSIYCAGPRYYIDCMSDCVRCGCGGGTFCPGCESLPCECASGTCANRHVGCAEFRYGQCHQEIVCSGRIACRVVSCTPPWVLDPTCSTVSETDDSTANHYASCLAPQPKQKEVDMFLIVLVDNGEIGVKNSHWLVTDNGLMFVGDNITNVFGPPTPVSNGQAVLWSTKVPKT